MADAFILYLIVGLGIKSIGILGCIIRFCKHSNSTDDIHHGLYDGYDMRTYILVEFQAVGIFILLVVFAREYPIIFCIVECLIQSCMGMLMACSGQVREMERNGNGIGNVAESREHVDTVDTLELRYTIMEEGMRTCLIGIQPSGHIVALVAR